MTFIDGILPPKTIKNGVRVRKGSAYFTLGNFVAMVTPGHNPDLLFLQSVGRSQ